jgi:hypothetical protein
MTKTITNGLILEIIDLGLNAVGDSGKKAVLFYLEQTSHFSREKIPENLELFEKSLRELFGLGYNFLDSILITKLQEATSENFSNHASFVECIKYLRNKPNNKL